jgi:hypothetical protein
VFPSVLDYRAEFGSDKGSFVTDRHRLRRIVFNLSRFVIAALGALQMKTARPLDADGRLPLSG